VGFNHALKLNDSLLAQSYVEAYDISYPEALRRIEQDTEELKQVLQNEGEYSLRNLGRLSLNNEGQYVFEPCEAGLLTPSLYGLSGFEFKLIQRRLNRKHKFLTLLFLKQSKKQMKSHIRFVEV